MRVGSKNSASEEQTGLLKHDFLIKVFPMGVVLLNKSDFPRPLPLFELLFSGDGRFGILVDLIVDKGLHTILLRESLSKLLFVLPPLTQELLLRTSSRFRGRISKTT
jgi:hypothetical protein